MSLSDMAGQLKFVQIQCVSVQNNSTTQCNVMMYGLTADGKVFFKTDREDKWRAESMTMQYVGRSA
jgi:hypothetical protein